MAGVAAYAVLLRDPELRRLLAGTQTARLGGSMLPLALVLFASETAGSPAAGGAVLAGFLLTSAFHPMRARLVDQRGGAALTLLVIGFAAVLAALTGLGALVSAPAPLVACAALAGALSPPLGPFTRAVTGAALEGRPDALQRAYALDSAGEEASLVLGPLLVAFMTAVWTTPAAVMLAAGLVLAGGLATAHSPLAEQLPGDAHAAPQQRLGLPDRVWLVVASLGATGAALGAIDVAVPAITRAAGAPATAGLVIAAMAVGTALASLLAGLHSWRWPALQRFAALQPALALALVACAVVRPLGALALVLMVAGAVVGVLFLTAYLAIGALAPHGAATRAFAWLITANNGGLALGAAVAGGVANSSPRAALWPAAIAGVLASVLAAAAATRRSRPANDIPPFAGEAGSR